MLDYDMKVISSARNALSLVEIMLSDDRFSVMKDYFDVLEQRDKSAEMVARSPERLMRIANHLAQFRGRMIEEWKAEALSIDSWDEKTQIIFYLEIHENYYFKDNHNHDLLMYRVAVGGVRDLTLSHIQRGRDYVRLVIQAARPIMAFKASASPIESIIENSGAKDYPWSVTGSDVFALKQELIEILPGELTEKIARLPIEEQVEIEDGSYRGTIFYPIKDELYFNQVGEILEGAAPYISKVSPD
jgi:hypothetical protein